MFLEAVRRLYAYNAAATEHLLRTAASVDPVRLLMPAVENLPSIRDSFVHLCEAQAAHTGTWMTLLGQAPGPKPYLEPKAYPDIASTEVLWATVNQRTAAFLATLSNEDDLG